MSDLSYRIRLRLDAEFAFKDRGAYLREGLCPSCGKKELWAYAENPRVVYCGRLNKCGYSAHVRDLFDDMFKSWSEHHPQTETNPNAAADAYLRDGRGFDLAPLKGHYSQETFRKGDLTTATVRFQITNTIHWERLIDQPERFGKDKARVSLGAKIAGHWWAYPKLDLTEASAIWITEGIFDAIALNQNNISAVSCISSNFYPEFALNQLKADCQAQNKPLPKLVWAFDNDDAGHKGTLNNHQRAQAEGWHSSAAMPPASHIKPLDWNELHEREQLSPDQLKKYQHYGQLLIAPSASEAGLLIYNFNDGKYKAFHFVHDRRTYWFDLDIEKYSKSIERIAESDQHLSEQEQREKALNECSAIQQICNAEITPIYFQRNDITDESWFYYQIHSPWGKTNLTFSPDQLSSRSKFKPRIMSAGKGIMWTGSDDKLEKILKKNEGIQEVKTIDFIGYSAQYQAYIFNQHAIYQGRIVPINQYDYYTCGRNDIKSLANSPTVELSTKPFNPSWYNDYWRVRGTKGLAVLAWWTGSYFAEQIRKITGSYPFIELVGQAGAGKSVLIEFLWKLSGQRDQEGFDPLKSSSIGMYRKMAQVSNMPVVMIEADRNDEGGKTSKKFSFDEFKDAYNGRPIRAIGRKNGNNDTYEPPFRGALMFSQNTIISASEAMLTRTLQIWVDRSGQTLETKRLVDRMHQMPVEDLASYMTQCLKKEADILQTYQQCLPIHEQDYHDSGINHTRIALCHAQIAALLDAISRHILDGYIDLEQVIDTQQLLKAIARQRIDSLDLDHPDVEKFWEVYEYMEHGRDIVINHHKDTDPTVAINLNDFYKWAFECRQQLPELNTIKQLLLSSKSYSFIKKNHPVRKKGSPDLTNNSPTIKCWIFKKPERPISH